MRDDGRILSALERVEQRLIQTERLVHRIQRDAERTRYFSGTVLGSSNALAQLVTGQRLYVDPRDRGCGINLLMDGKIEDDEMTVLKRYLRPGGTMLDIGANYGTYSILMAPYLQPGGRIIGFEPNPHICDLFRASIYLNGLTGMVEARQLGVHDADGMLHFHISDSGPGGGHVVAEGAFANQGEAIIEVPVVRLDDHLPPDFVVDAVKIDVEGHEPHVLRGMRGIIARSPDIVILMELFYAYFPSDAEFVGFVNFIQDELGLTISRIGPRATLTPADAESLRGQSSNVLLTKGAARAMPDMTVWPIQFHLGGGAQLKDGVIHWAGTQDQVPGFVAHGPYLYLPKGHYRLVVDADFEGRFACTLQENHGQHIGSWQVAPGEGFSIDLSLALDAPAFEIGLRPAQDGPSALRLRKAELWKID